MNDTNLIVITEVKTKPERQAPVWSAMAEIAQGGAGIYGLPGVPHTAV